MSDPVEKAVTAAKISTLFSDPDMGARLSRLIPVAVDEFREGIAAFGRELRYSRSFVKSLTVTELRAKLTEVAKGIPSEDR
ncbi:hypothetical protein MRBLMR1_005903 [Neorhizobium sp. LMR1-1-1.1]